MKIEKIVIDCMRATPELTPLEIEEFLEWLQDNEMLNKKGDKLKHSFWELFWKDKE